LFSLSLGVFPFHHNGLLWKGDRCLVERGVLGKEMASEPLTIAELARAVGMTTKDVSFYQERGLLQKPARRRGRSGDVAYTQDHVDRLNFISRALILGFSLDAIGRIVDGSRMTTCRDMYDLADTQLQRIRSLLGPDAPSAHFLEELMTACASSGAREDCTIYAAMARPPLRSGKE
jgi:MerR family mercuric resistance operon transcriptional regulator